MSLYRLVVIRAWWLVLLAVLGTTAYLARHIPDLIVDAGTNVLINEDDPDLSFYYETRAVWGYDEYAIVAVTADDWFTPEGTQRARDIVADLGRVANAERTFSVLDVPLLRQPGASVFSPPNLRGPKVDFPAAREELLGHTQAAGTLISKDGRSLGILVYLAVPEESVALDREWSRLMSLKQSDPSAVDNLDAIRERKERVNDLLRQRRMALIHGIRDVAKKWTPELAGPVRISGVSALNINLIEHVEYDLRVFSIAALALLSFVLLVVYRRARFVLIPVLTCLLPVALIIGTMAWQEMKITVITSNLPVLLFVLMLPYTVYFAERYLERRGSHPDESGRESTVRAAAGIWTPCLFSCATTMAGFSALMTSGILPVRTFGKMMTIGMGVGLAVVFLIAPALSAPLSALRGRGGSEPRRPGLTRPFVWVCLRAPGLVVLFSAVLLGVAIWGASRLEAEAKVTEYFWPDSEVYQGLEFVDRNLGGTTSLEIFLESDEPNFFLTKPGFRALEAAAEYFDDVPETGNVRSLKTVVDEVAKKSPMLVHPMMLRNLVKMPQVKSITSEYANEDFTVTRIFVRMQETAPTLHRNRILTGLRQHLATHPDLKGLKVVETGVFLQYANMLNSLLRSQRETFLLVIGAIFLMLVVLLRHPVLALLVLLPQVLPAVVMLGVMGWMRIPLDLVTVMIASVAMGVGIDAAIQYTIRFRQELADCRDPRLALERTHATTGRAIWIATTVIVVGFCVLMLSRFRPSVWFGLFTGIAMLMSQFAALTTLPSIFLLTGFPRIPANSLPSGASEGGEQSPLEPTNDPPDAA